MSLAKKLFRDKKRAIDACLKGDAECFDCKSKITTDNEEIKNGALVNYEDNGEDIFVFRCDQCLSENPELSEYKECEVYSRIVGYLRPVRQWNEGKQQEYRERKEYKVV